jgi:uncharacterized membrane protein YfcA
MGVFEWLVSIFCGLLIGMAKSGLLGVILLVVPVMAMVFGGKPSTGIVLPMLVMADFFAVFYYNRYASWKHLVKLMPWAMVGIILAMLIGNMVTDQLFMTLLSITVLFGTTLMIWQDLNKSVVIPESWWFSTVTGLLGGFTTMIGNASGPVLFIYLLSLKIPKYNFIGTAAWFYLLVNLIKVPLHVLSWKTITASTIIFNLSLSPFIIAGMLVGIRIVKIIPEKPYRIFIICTIAVSAIVLLLK